MQASMENQASVWIVLTATSAGLATHRPPPKLASVFRSSAER